MKVLKFHAAIAAKPQHHINPLRIVTESDIWEQNEPLPIEREDSEEMILNEFETMFSTMDKLFRVVEKAGIQAEEHSYSSNSRALSSALTDIESIAPHRKKDAMYYLKCALHSLSDDTLNDVFCEVCEDPNLVLQSDFM